jgi:predicted O-methyltransferase YrrM
MIFDLINYWLKAKNAHGIHSPFVYEFYTQVYKSKSVYSNNIESLRRELKNNTAIVSIKDFGAGSKVNASNKRTVGDIARKSLKSPFYSAFLYRIIQHYTYEEVLELGTSLGLTTAYLSEASPKGKIYTLEGCKETLDVAKDNFNRLHLKNIHTIEGNIDYTLPELLKEVPKLDCVLFDANHRYEPTLRYFEACLEKAHEKTAFIFDDIYWSKEMKNAWQSIVLDPRVSISMDFYQMGLVFFNKGVRKQHFVLK